MKFQLDQSVIFEGREAIIWDYSIRYNEYDIKLKSGKVIHGIKDNEIQLNLYTQEVVDNETRN